MCMFVLGCGVGGIVIGGMWPHVCVLRRRPMRSDFMHCACYVYVCCGLGVGGIVIGDMWPHVCLVIGGHVASCVWSGALGLDHASRRMFKTYSLRAAVAS